MEKRKEPVFSMVLYILAVVLALYALWSFMENFGYISELIATEQLAFAGSEFDIISFHMSGSAQYAIFAVMLFALGVIMKKTAQAAIAPVAPAVPVVEKQETGENNEWFEK